MAERSGNPLSSGRGAVNYTLEAARKLLENSGVFFETDPEDDTPEQTINFNDSYWWATAHGQRVEDSELPELARLFYDYGWCGVLYWGGNKMGKGTIEFEDVKRKIQFVALEEAGRKLVPGDSARAYYDTHYKIDGKI